MQFADIDSANCNLLCMCAMCRLQIHDLQIACGQSANCRSGICNLHVLHTRFADTGHATCDCRTCNLHVPTSANCKSSHLQFAVFGSAICRSRICNLQIPDLQIAGQNLQSACQNLQSAGPKSANCRPGSANCRPASRRRGKSPPARRRAVRSLGPKSSAAAQDFRSRRSSSSMNFLAGASNAGSRAPCALEDPFGGASRQIGSV